VPLNLPGAAKALELVCIEAGSFTMGSPESEQERDSDETQHRVTLSKPFWLGQYAVTQGQWEALMRGNPSDFKQVGKDAPVENVSWDDAMAFCKKLTELERASGRLPEGYEYTLPTESEWEYACRAGTTTPFHTGANLTTSQGNYDGNYPYAGNAKGECRWATTKVGSFAPNAWGLYDMHGNVWEGCLDWKGDYPKGAVIDPTDAIAGSGRVLRGGCWFNLARYCRSASRSRNEPGLRNYYLGFRLALRSVGNK
jgi:formylglycine-generating enzyme required for sulfatase activity